MATYVGGLRARLVHDNVFDTIRGGLDDLGWFDAGRQHQPINVIAEPTAAATEVPLNTVSVSTSGTDGTDAEMGSNMIEDRTTFYVDIYGESDVLGKHLAYDVRDILRGKVPSIGRTRPVIDVRDLTSPANPTIAVCDVDDVIVDRSISFQQPWQRHWWVVRFDVVDPYGDEEDS